jgi:hypothetical protein
VSGLLVPGVVILLAGLVAAWWLSSGSGTGLDVAPARAPVVNAPPPPPGIAEGSLPPFAVVFGGELDGRFWVPPCADLPSGGPARAQAAVLDAVAGMPSALVVGTGDHCGSAGDAGALEWGAGMAILAEAGLAVDAVGEKDLLLGLDRWRAHKAALSIPVPVVCSNLRDAAGQPLVPTVVPLESGKRRILVASYLSPSYELDLRAAGVDVRLLPPVEAVKDAFAGTGKADFRIVLCHGPADEARRIASQLAGVHLFVSAHGGELPSARPERIADGAFVVAGRGWRHLGRATFGPRDGRTELLDYASMPVGRTHGESPISRDRIRTLEKSLGAAGVLEASLREASLRPAAAARGHAGAASCASCHAGIHGKATSPPDPHAAAMASVRKAGFERRAACLSCHATGAGEPGGHAVPGDAQAAVSCEACHGPAEAHVRASGMAPTTARDPYASCLRCHTPEMSPGFDPRAAWPRVSHGK